jgi:hypothetical protein
LYVAKDIFVLEVFCVDLIEERYWIGSDKELTLQILNLNNVRSIELVDPKVCTYPIVGRKYGQHGGKDISMIHTMEQAIDESYDFYMKLYSIEAEYYLEVEGLSVKKASIAFVQHAIYNEIPIRTTAFGWEWKEVGESELLDEWKTMAIRALYVTGLTHGFVKIGILANESAIVLDINPSNEKFSEEVKEPDIPFTIGADIEFMLSCNHEFLPASTFFPIEGDVGCDERQIEKDSGEYALVEIRPEKGETPQELFTHIQDLIEKASKMVPYENIEFHAGSMPFRGYQCGGHLHFGIPSSLSLLRALDHYLALPIAMIEEPRTAKLRRRTNHGGIGRFREKIYGFEYISLSSWLIEPKLTKSILCLAYLVATHHHELKTGFLFRSTIQRAYYHGNVHILKHLWGEIKIALMNTSSYTKFERELEYLFDRIENGNNFNESCDIRQNWELTVPNQTYDTGLIIQIPKKIRQKYNLKEGESTFVCAGKNMSSATIHAYPFSFQNPNMIQLSKSLRSKLTLPQNWNPKLLSSGGVITLGPIIGILAARPFDRQTTYFHHLFRLAKERQMFIYVFEPQDIIWDQQVIKGTTLNGEGVFPFPAVIYDRFLFRGKTNIDYDIDEVRAKLQTLYQIPFLNPPSLFQLTGDKWETHRLLLNEYEEYLPETRLMDNEKVLNEMLDRYGEVYMKPVFGGSMSKGVIRIIRRPTEVSLFYLNTKTVHQFRRVEELFAIILPLIKTTPHLIQEGIRRKKYNGSNLEIRVYMQKNEKQIWLRTGMVTRLTSEEVMTEDLEVNLKLSKVMNSLYQNPIERRDMTNRLGNIAKKIVTTVEQEIGEFGELAVDLCIDQYESIKLLEINAKPDNLFSQIRAYKLRSLAGIRLLNYAASLAGYKDQETSK